MPASQCFCSHHSQIPSHFCLNAYFCTHKRHFQLLTTASRAVPVVRPQVPSEQRPHKVSFKLQSPSAQEAPQGTQAPEGLEGAPGHGEHQQLSPAAMLQRLEEALKAQQLNTRVIYSGEAGFVSELLIKRRL